MPLLNSIVSWFNTKRLHQLDLSMRYPFDVQRETFQKLMGKAEDTEWGKTYGYRSITSTEDFQKRVPVQDYDDIKKYIIRLRQGEKNLLWPGSIKWFAKSSGTTSEKSKFIPVSRDALEYCHFRGGKDVLAFYTSQFPETKIFRGKGLTLGGSHQINNFNNDSYYGDLSAILIQNLPYWVDFIRTPKFNISTIKGSWKNNKYISKNISPNVIFEGLLALYFAFGMYSAFVVGDQGGDFGLFPFHLMLFVGFGYVFIKSITSKI